MACRESSFQPGISHDYADGSPAARVRWFRTLTVQQRMEWLTGIQKLAWDANGGHMPRKRDAKPIPGRVEILELPESEIRRDLIRSKQATGRPVDIEDIRLLKLSR